MKEMVVPKMKEGLFFERFIEIYFFLLYNE